MRSYTLEVEFDTYDILDIQEAGQNVVVFNPSFCGRYQRDG